MKSETIQILQNQFDSISRRIPGEDIEFWFARDLKEPLGYARWENFKTVVKRAVESCVTTGYDPDNHFRGVTQMVLLGSGAERAVAREHVQKNQSVRSMLGQRGIKPENLPPEEDIKKLERRVKSEEKKIEMRSGRLPEAKDR